MVPPRRSNGAEQRGTSPESSVPRLVAYLAVGGESRHPVGDVPPGRDQMACPRHGKGSPRTDGDQRQGCSDHHQKNATTHIARPLFCRHRRRRQRRGTPARAPPNSVPATDRGTARQIRGRRSTAGCTSAVARPARSGTANPRARRRRCRTAGRRRSARHRNSCRGFRVGRVVHAVVRRRVEHPFERAELDTGGVDVELVEQVEVRRDETGPGGAKP